MKQPKPTGLALVGFLIICFWLGLAQAQPNHSASGYPDGLDESGLYLTGIGQGSGSGQLKLADSILYFPWATQHASGSRPYLPGCTSRATVSSVSQNEDITLDRSHEKAELEKLSALNSVKLRNLVYEDSQYEDSQNGSPGGQETSNSLDLAVTGGVNALGSGNAMPGAGDDEQSVAHDLFMKLRDESATDQAPGSPGLKSFGNYLNIDVHGISVQAINTVEGGNAVATSNIIINPVQTIICAPEVQEKLK